MKHKKHLRKQGEDGVGNEPGDHSSCPPSPSADEEKGGKCGGEDGDAEKDDKFKKTLFEMGQVERSPFGFGFFQQQAAAAAAAAAA